MLITYNAYTLLILHVYFSQVHYKPLAVPTRKLVEPGPELVSELALVLVVSTPQLPRLSYSRRVEGCSLH